MKITAVVVTYNRLELLRKVVDGLRRNNLSDIIVVNNGSTDGTQEWLEAQTHLNVVHQDNVGGSGGFYTGIKKAYDEGADWIWCMDDDVTPIVGCDFEGPFISRKVVERIGLPNKDLFIFCDDTDYCLRAHLAGFKLLYVPQALMDKHVFFSTDSWAERNRKKKWKRYYQVRNSAYLNHHYGRNWGVRYLRSFISMLGYYLPALLTMPFTSAWQPSDLAMLWQAYTDGINERLGKR